MSAATLWAQLVTQYRGAELSRGIMRDQDATQQIRDEATMRYSRACDQLVKVLGQMADQQLLTQIGSLLNGRAR